jgi:hypothetical protein
MDRELEESVGGEPGLRLQPEPLRLPPFAAPWMDGVVAGRRMTKSVRGYFARLIRHLDAIGWKKCRIASLIEADAILLSAMMEKDADRHRTNIRRRVARVVKIKFGRHSKPPRYQIAGAAGLGKTQALIENYRRSPAMWGKHILYFVPNVALGHCLVDDLNRNAPPGMPLARLTVGRTHTDERMPSPPCKRAEVVGEAKNKLGSIYKAFCNDGKGNVCEFYRVCDYINNRKEQSPCIRVMPHASLTVPQVGDLALVPPDFVIVDESCVSAFVKHAQVYPADFENIDTYYRASASDDKNACAEAHAALGKKIIGQIIASNNFLTEIQDEERERIHQESHMSGLGARDLTNPSLLVNRLRSAAAAAAQPVTACTIVPGDSDDVVRTKLKGMLPNPGRGVAMVYRQLARDLENGLTQSNAIERRMTVDLEAKSTPGKEFEPHVKCHGLKDAIFSESVPLLLLDADAIQNVNNRLFCRGGATFPLRALEFRAVRRVKVIQCDSSSFAKKHFEPNFSHEAMDRGMDLAHRIVALAHQRVALGNKVLVVTNKPIRVKLAGETVDSLPLFARIGHSIEVTHFGAFIGQDRWKSFDTVIVVGREQPPPAAVEQIARAVYADDLTPLKFSSSYVEAQRQYDPQGVVWGRVWAHADPRAQEILELLRERQSVQAIDRLRLIHSDRTATAIILCDQPLPGIVPDRLASAKDILAGGTRLERARQRGGFLSRNATVLAGAYPDIWKTAKAAEHDIHQSFPKTPELQEENILYAKGGALISGEFRVAGARRWSFFVFDTERCRAPERVITRALGLDATVPVDFRGEEWKAYKARRRALAINSAVEGEPTAAVAKRDVHGRNPAPGRPIIILVRLEAVKGLKWFQARALPAQPIPTQTCP